MLRVRNIFTVSNAANKFTIRRTAPASLPSRPCWINQRLFMVTGSQYQALMDLLERPEQANGGLRDLFARKAPWDAK